MLEVLLSLLDSFIYSDLPTQRTPQDTISVDEPENVSECRDSFIRWITTFTITTVQKVSSDIIKSVDVIYSSVLHLVLSKHAAYAVNKHIILVC